MTLEEIPAGTRVFLDSTIFIYHFSQASPECRRLLERCERQDVKGLSSVTVIAEVAHRLMMIEAVQIGLVRGANIPKKLRARPDAVRRLHLYQDAVDQIPLMGIEIATGDLATLLGSREIRRRHGLLVNDSLVVASALSQRATALASADRDFEKVEGLRLYRPTDLG